MTRTELIQLTGLTEAQLKGELIPGHLDLDSLTTLPEGVTLTAGGNLYLRSLTTLPEGVTLTAGGDLYLRSLTTLPAGVTLTAGGDLDLRSLTILPEGVTINSKVERNTLRWKTSAKTYAKIDGQFMEVHSERQVGSQTLIKGATVNGEPLYVVGTNGIYAHGDTLQEAKSDLYFKLNRDKLANVNLTPDTEVTVEMYRAISGACRKGVQLWRKQHGVAATSMKAGELVKLLEQTGAYGATTFKAKIQNR